MEGDEGRLIQPIRNLLGNAVKFTEKGAVRLQVLNDEKGVMFRISDTGIGIPEDQRMRIFDKFTQANNTSTRKFGGTGLGLAICKQLVEMMPNGEIVDSELGSGSTFWFSLPLKECSVGDEGSGRLRNRAKKLFIRTGGKMNKNAKILLAEDYPTNQFLVKRILNKNGFANVDIVENGREAVEAYNVGNYDIILMDGMMPEMDGYEATRTIRASVRDQRKHIPVIAMTANAMVGDREKCLEAGMDDYISKPVDAQKFMKLMAKWAPNLESPKQAPPRKYTYTNKPLNNPQGRSTSPTSKALPKPDRDVEKELFGIFIDQMGLGLSSLETFVADGRNADWKSAAHRLKGAAANLGAEKLAALCFEAEKGLNEPEDRKKAMLAAINEEAEVVHAFIEKRIA